MNNYLMKKKTTDFGKKSRAYRAGLGLNMTQAARETGIKQPTISKIEKGELSPSLDFIKKSITAYEIKERTEQMGFLLSSLNSSQEIVIPLKELGPVRKEWLAALCIFGDLDKNNPKGWDTLIDWTKGLLKRLKDLKPNYNNLRRENQPL
jgi:transcriptional regulator with XRE-family HTH domain